MRLITSLTAVTAIAQCATATFGGGGGYDGTMNNHSGGCKGGCQGGEGSGGGDTNKNPSGGCKGGGGYDGCHGGGGGDGGGSITKNNPGGGCNGGCQGGGGGGGSPDIYTDAGKPPIVVNKATSSVYQPQPTTDVYSPPSIYTKQTGSSFSSEVVGATSIIKTPIQPSPTGYPGGSRNGSGGVIAKTYVPAQAAIVNWRLVYDLDVKVENKFRFEICEPSDQGRVVTKIRDQYVYGVAISHKTTSSGGAELICDNGGLQQVAIENNKVDVKPAAKNATQESRGVVYKCSDISQCKKSSCECDMCRTNLVAQVEGEASASATITYTFKECKSQDDCYRVQTCVDNKCSGNKPPQGSASAPIPVTQVTASTPGEIARGSSGRTNGSDSGRPNGPTSGSATTIAALNVLAGAVVLAFIL